ncbi:motile sperm domain-containing protein 2-like [Centruroides vittatus]|uniref:motile sperm domain-containing protein 2-like n=1 Tax=Centruroides vittatus TaxID=120091 RepID=UPI00350F8ED7
MPELTNSKIPPPDRQTVEELRKQVLEEIEKSPESYYAEDVKRLKDDDEFVKRFIVHQALLHPSEDRLKNGIAMAKKEFKWRKENSIREIKRDELPTEFFDRQVIVPYNRDKNGCCTVFLRAKKVRRTSSAEKQDLERFVTYWIESVESINPGEMFTIIIDCTGAGLSNANMDLLTLLINMVKEHYLAIVGHIIVANLPSILVATWKIVKYLLPPAAVEKVKFVDNKTIGEYIEEDRLPPHLGGTNNQEFGYYPFIFAENYPKCNDTRMV